MIRKGCLAAAVLLLVTGLCRAQGSARSSAYDSLEPMALSETLSSFGMGELLEAFVREKQSTGEGDSVEFLSLLADSRISQARAAEDTVRRERLFDSAVQELRKILDKLGEGNKPETVKKRFEYQLKLADTMGRVRIQPYVDGLIFLAAAEEDRKTVIATTAEAAKILRTLRREVQDTKRQWSRDNRIWIVYGWELEKFEALMEWQGAIIALYRAMALHEEIAQERGEKQTLLNQVIASLRRFLKGDDVVQQPEPWAFLFTGRALRELRDHKPAAEMLQKAAEPDMPPRIRYEALFEICRNRIEGGDFSAARKEVETFGDEARKILENDPQGGIQVDLMSALLLHYLHETQAKGETDDVKVKEHRLRAERALLGFVNKYADSERLIGDFMRIIAGKYRDRTDLENLGPVILLARARTMAAEGSPAAMREAEELLTAARKRDDQIAREVRPLVLWDLGIVMNRLRRNLECAHAFMGIAADYPTHKLASRAAVIAVATYAQLLQDRMANNVPIDPNLRAEYVGALELLLGRPGTEPQVANWNLALGQQYRALARPGVVAGPEQRFEHLRKAVAALGKVPAASPDYLEGRYLGLLSRLELLREVDKPKADKRQEAEDLTGRLRTYAADVARVAGATGDKELRRFLRDWGSWAGFEAIVLRHEYLGQPEEVVLRDLDKLVSAEVWKGTDILLNAKEYEIRILVESPRDRTEEAVRKVEAFLKQYPKEAGGVLGLVVQRIRERIKQLRKDARTVTELERYRKTYLTFARALERIAVRDDFRGVRLYLTKQSLADALTEAGQPAEAMKYWQDCFTADQQRRDAEAKRIDEEFSPRIQKVEDAGRNPAILHALADEYFRLLTERRIRVEDTRTARAVQSALADMDAVGHDPDLRDARAAAAAEKLKEALTGLRDQSRRRLAIDARNVLGLARTHRALKDYRKATEFYKKMVGGVDRTRPELYWTVHLEFCQTVLEGYADDPQEMKRLRLYIRRLQLEDPGMGGENSKQEFLKIAGRASRLVE